jgi:hypothetical protein
MQNVRSGVNTVTVPNLFVHAAWALGLGDVEDAPQFIDNTLLPDKTVQPLRACTVFL